MRIIQQHLESVTGSQRGDMIPLQPFIRSFARLDRQKQEMMGDPAPFIEYLVADQEATGYFDYISTYPKPLPQFRDLNEAWTSLHQRWHMLLKWVKAMHCGWVSGFPHDSKLEVQKKSLAYDFQLWESGLHELGATMHDRSPREASIYKLLECHVILADSVLETASSPLEMKWDDRVEQFQRVVEACRVITESEMAGAVTFPLASPPQILVKGRYAPDLADSATTSTMKPKSPLTFDMGVCMILLHVVNKCRDARVRYDAIRLLEEHPRLEGVWDSLIIAQVGRAIDDVERNGASLEEASARGAPAAEIPSDQRVVMTKAVLSDKVRSADLLLMRATTEGESDTTWLRRALTW